MCHEGHRWATWRRHMLSENENIYSRRWEHGNQTWKQTGKPSTNPMISAWAQFLRAVSSKCPFYVVSPVTGIPDKFCFCSAPKFLLNPPSATVAIECFKFHNLIPPKTEVRCTPGRTDVIRLLSRNWVRLLILSAKIARMNMLEEGRDITARQRNHWYDV